MKLRVLLIKISTVLIAAAGIAAMLASCGPHSMVTYYGCPNSKRIDKLNLKRTKIGK